MIMIEYPNAIRPGNDFIIAKIFELGPLPIEMVNAMCSKPSAERLEKSYLMTFHDPDRNEWHRMSACMSRMTRSFL